MHRNTRILASLVMCGAPLLLGGAKPAPANPAFVPALVYKYNPDEVRLSNANGTQAILLVKKARGESILWLSMAPVSQGRAAYIDATSSGTVRSLRIVSWTPQTGGGVTVTNDAQPLIASQNSGIALAGLDFSPDGSKLAVLSTDYDTISQLRIFDVATRQQVGDAISLAHLVSSLGWRAFDNSILLRGPGGLFSYKDGVETTLFNAPNQGAELDAFNGTAPDVILPFKDYPVQGNLIHRWDGTTVNGGTAVTSIITSNGVWPNMSCDNSRMIYSELGAKRTGYNLVLATGVKEFFSKDSNVQRMTYPNSCG